MRIYMSSLFYFPVVFVVYGTDYLEILMWFFSGFESLIKHNLLCEEDILPMKSTLDLLIYNLKGKKTRLVDLQHKEHDRFVDFFPIWYYWKYKEIDGYQ